LVIGVSAGALCFVATNFLKRRLHVDDSLDVFPVHGVGGLLGTLLTGFFASDALGIFSGQENIAIGHQLGVQAIGAFSAMAYTVIVTFVILKIVGAVTSLRVSPEEETEGLDLVLHNERGYDL
jgi:Amt family ammonium transporter